MTKPCLPPLSSIERPAFTPPAGACDSHAHVFGPYDAFPLAEDRSYTPQEFPPEAFIQHLERLGLSRGVLVTGSASGKDNGAVLQALRQYPERLRGVVVPAPDTSDATLHQWHEAGIRGVRVNLFQRDGHAVYRNGVGLDVLERLAPRIADLGWHAQIWIHAPDLVEMAPKLEKLRLPLVIDHMGRMSTHHGTTDPGFQRLCAMLAEGTAWTKVSGADRNTVSGAPYLDIDPFVDAVLHANPKHVVWGTDWPHINYFEANQVPDDGALLNLLLRWIPDEQTRQSVLVDNPKRLYDF